MNAKEVMQALIDGKKVRRQCWDAGNYVYIINGKIKDNYERVIVPLFNENDWELYQDTPKQKLETEFIDIDWEE